MITHERHHRKEEDTCSHGTTEEECCGQCEAEKVDAALDEMKGGV